MADIKVYCTDSEKKRLSDHIPKNQYSSFIRELIRKELDIMDVEYEERCTREKLLNELVFPEVKTYSSDILTSLWNGTEITRNNHRETLPLKITDEEFTSVIFEVLKNE
jgi:hypothetical protein